MSFNTTAASLAFDDDILPSIMSPDTYKVIHKICSDYASSAICVVGTANNLVNCLVFWRQGLGDRMNLCLFCLALADLGLLVCTFAFSSISFFLSFTDKGFSEEYLIKAITGGGGVLYGFRLASGCISMIIALERCLCVMFPLKAAFLIRTRTVGLLLATSFCLLQLGQVALPLKVTAAAVFNNMTGETAWQMVPTRLGVTHSAVLDAVQNTVLSVCVPVLTFVVVCAATGLTVCRLRLAMQWREMSSATHSEAKGRQVALTKMLVLVSCVYIVSMAPFVAVIIARLIVPDFSPYGRHAILYLACITIVNQLPLLNSSATFFVYCAQSTRYRAHLRTVLRCPGKGGNLSAKF